MDRESTTREEHIVLIIHGTWNAPDKSGAGVLKWYQLDDSHKDGFARGLNDRLETTAIGRAVRTKIPGRNSCFSWSGDNQHAARLDAATRLAEDLWTLTCNSAVRLHLIAHSHGGNVVLRAIQLLRERISAEMKDESRSVWRSASQMAQTGVDPHTAAEDALKSSDWPRPVRGSLNPVQEVLGIGLGRMARRKELGLFERVRMRFSRYTTRSDDWRLFGKFRGAYQEVLHDMGIGRVVFLGTPFYLKTWTVGRSLGSRTLDITYRTVGALVGSLAFVIPGVYVSIMMYGGLLALAPFVTFLGWNPFGWPRWVQGIGLFVGVVFFAGNTWESATQTGRTDGNLYDTEDISEWDPKIDALVVSAGLLDEALLALSAEPLAHSFLLPALADILEPKPWGRLDAPGSRWSPSAGNVTRRVVRWAGTQLMSVVALPLLPLRIATRQLLQRYLTNTILKVAVNTGFGLPNAESRGARIEVTPQPRKLPQYRLRYWDVSQTLAEVPPPQIRRAAEIVKKVMECAGEGSITDGPVSVSQFVSEMEDALDAADVRRTYSFLWDNDELERRARDSTTWGKVNEQLSEVLKRMLSDGSERELRQLKRTCVMADTRVHEFAGAVQLAHSTYYSNPAVLDGIAAFLAGDTGPWQEPK